MPRNDLKAYGSVIARIPQDLLDQVKQYASRHRCSVSELIREGLEMRLEADVPGRSRDSRGDAGGEVLQEVLQAVHALAPRGHTALAGTIRQTITEVLREVLPLYVSGQTPADEVLHEVVPPETADAPVSQYGAGFDTTRFVVGELCPQGHRYPETAGSLRYVKGDHDCVTCRSLRSQRYNEHKRAKRRQKAAPQQQG